jgi:hypothetical protein
MSSPRFFVGWIISAVLMYILFYVFHGVLTNDLIKISLPKSVFLTVAGFVYILLAFGMSVLLDATFFKKEVKNIYTRAFIAGPVIGIFLYAVALIVGVSFSAKFSMINMLVDVSWQVVEQSVGIIVIAFVKVITFDPNEIEV